MSRTRQLEQESARETALARLEAKVPRFAPPLFLDLACRIVDNLEVVCAAVRVLVLRKGCVCVAEGAGARKGAQVDSSQG